MQALFKQTDSDWRFVRRLMHNAMHTQPLHPCLYLAQQYKINQSINQASTVKYKVVGETSNTVHVHGIVDAKEKLK